MRQGKVFAQVCQAASSIALFNFRVRRGSREREQKRESETERDRFETCGSVACECEFWAMRWFCLSESKPKSNSTNNFPLSKSDRGGFKLKFGSAFGCPFGCTGLVL